MKPKGDTKVEADKRVPDIKRATRLKFSAEEKIPYGQKTRTRWCNRGKQTCPNSENRSKTGFVVYEVRRDDVSA